MTPKVLFAHISMYKLAGTLIKGTEVGEIQWETFKDGWPNLFIENAVSIKNRDVVFVANLAKPEMLFEQLAIIYALPRHFVRSLKVIVPFYPVGTMERVSVYGEIATAETLARMLSATPMTQSGPVVFSIFDIHALQGQFYFNDQILPELVSGIPLLKKRIEDIKEIAIAFPDDGSHKRFGVMFPEYPHIICNKVRMPDGKKVVTIKEGNPHGKYVVIVDDLIQTGGTLIECRNALIRQGAWKVSAYATHGVFAEKSYENFIAGLFDYVWFTDSCPDTVEMTRGKSGFEVLSLAPLIAELI